jgi:hypothetical protein
MKNKISKEKAWELFKEECRTAHEDWTPEFFLIAWLKEHNLQLE